MSEDPGRNFRTLQKEMFKQLRKPEDEKSVTDQVTSEIVL